LIDVVVMGEGQTEYQFVQAVLLPALAERGVLVQARLIATSSLSKGGALARGRVLRGCRNALLQRPDTYVTTLFDLYGLRPDFPGFAEAAAIRDPIARATRIEEHLAIEVVALARCRADRFFAHIQPHEFEALLFTGVEQFGEVVAGWKKFDSQLRAARASGESPEHINNDPASHPSARLGNILTPRFEKVLHGPNIAARIGLTRIRAECAHFGAWLTRLESLPPLQPDG
jgi:hypothetical protein